MKTCSVPGCSNRHLSKGFCSTHYKWSRDGKSMTGNISTRNYERRECLVPNCKSTCTSNGWCRNCIRSWHRYGGPVAPKRDRYTCIDSRGYEVWNACHPDNPYDHQVYGHRRTMEMVLGRELFSHENVHHKNGIRTDNRPENLELWTTSQPKGQRVKDKLEWARMIIDLYG